MAYISSNNNRFYVALEGTYGQAATAAAQNRIPAVKLAVKHRPEKIQRKDKTGTRTFLGEPSPLRNTTTFTLTTYMANWLNQTQEPGYGALFQACLGGAAMLSPGGRVASADPSRIAFATAHGLAPGQAVSAGDEIRFVTNVVDDHTVLVNVPFTTPIPADTITGSTATYKPASDLSSATIYDRWDPAGAVQRLISGAAVNDLIVKVNGDFHEFEFSGDASDLIDSASFESGQAGLTAFPDEPAVGPLNYSIIPGHLGQVWLGSSQPSEFLTLTKAQLHFNNDLGLRADEFGSTLPRAIAPGIRDVTLDFSLYEQDDAATQALYQAARQRSPVGIMIQLGQRPGELFGIYMKSVVPEVPEFDDADRRLQWQFQNCRAQGGLDDEIFVAFG